MTLSDTVKTQLETIAGHPTVYLRAEGGWSDTGACWIVSHEPSSLECCDVSDSLNEVHTPFKVEIHQGTDTLLATDIGNIKTYIKAKTVTGGFWTLAGKGDPDTLPGKVAVGVVDAEEVKWE